MTTKKRSPLSLRLKKYRKAAGFNSPAQLAETIENPLVAKSKIVNLEQGRKSDITITEACLLVARALGIPVLALVCDIDRPFGEPDLVGFDGWHNTDLFALFTVPDGSYGPVSEVCADSFKPNIDLDVKRDYLQLVYTWVRYLAGGIAGFNESMQKLLIKQL